MGPESDDNMLNLASITTKMAYGAMLIDLRTDIRKFLSGSTNYFPERLIITET